MFSKFQIDHFQLVMDTILRKYNSFSVPLTECSNLSLDLDPRTNLELAEKFVIRMIQQNYFAKMTFEVILIKLNDFNKFDWSTFHRLHRMNSMLPLAFVEFESLNQFYESSTTRCFLAAATVKRFFCTYGNWWKILIF